MAHIRLGVSQCLQNIGEELIHEQTNIESKPVALVSRVGIEPTTHGLKVRCSSPSQLSSRLRF